VSLPDDYRALIERYGTVLFGDFITIFNPAAKCAEPARAPYVSHVYALAEFKAAMGSKRNGEVIGGCVLHP